MRIFIDFKSAASYLAMQPTLALLHKYQLDAKWLPLQAVMHKSGQLSKQATQGEIHRYVRARARQQTHLLYAELQGTSMLFPAEPKPTDVALAALHYVAASADPVRFIQAAFAAYWQQQLDLNDAQVVTNLLQQQGYDTVNLDSAMHLKATLAEQEVARAAGVVDVPAYVLNQQVFIGREHLPWIEAIISGAETNEG